MIYGFIHNLILKMIFGSIHNHWMPNVIFSLCITLSKSTDQDRIDIREGGVLTIQICIRFRSFRI
jgi:hypothetical protein